MRYRCVAQDYRNGAIEAILEFRSLARATAPGRAGAGWGWGPKNRKNFFSIFFIFSTDNAKGTSLPSEKPNRNDILTFFDTFYVVLRK